MPQKYSGRKVLTKVLVEPTRKVVEIHFLKNVFDKVFETPDLQQLVKLKISKKTVIGSC